MVAASSLFLIALAVVAQSPYNIDTIAGSSVAGDGGPALSAILSQPEGVLADAAGNIYIADANDHRVRKVAADGTIQTVVGTGVPGFSGDGGLALSAQLNQPYGLALDLNGNLYIADLGNSRVRRVSPDGVIATFAGGGTIVPGGNGDGGSALLVVLKSPRNLALGPNGDLYISDFGAHQIYLVSAASGVLTTVAGSGFPGYAGDGGAAMLGQLAFPAGIAMDAQGVLYIADSSNDCIRSISANAIATVASVVKPTGVAVDANGNLYVAAAQMLGPPGNPVPNSSTFFARDLALNALGNIIFSSGAVVQQAMSDGTLTLLAGNVGGTFSGDGGPAISARLEAPSGTAIDAAGNLYIADRNNNRVRMVTPSGIISTVAGTGDASVLNHPYGVAAAGGHLYISDTGNNRVLKLSAGVLVMVLDRLSGPTGLAAAADGTLYVADSGNDRILTLMPSGVVQITASATQADELALDAAGNLYVSQTAANQLIKLAPGGAVSTLLQGLAAPAGLTVDAAGNLFVAESGANRVFELTASGSVVILAGSNEPGFSGDGGPASDAALNAPLGVVIDAAGTIFIADTGNNRIRKLTPPPLSDFTTPVLVNAASSLPGSIAPNEIVTLYGSGFDPVSSVVAFNGQPTTLFYVDSKQINLLAPSTLVPGTMTDVSVTAGGAPRGSLTVPVADASPAIFAVGGGVGQAAALNQDGSMNSASNPASRGSIAVFFATGQGTGNSAVSMVMGGYPCEVLYAGNAPGFVGLMQINARVPSGFLPSGALPVVLWIGALSSQPGVTLSVL